MSFPRYPEYKDSGVEWLGEVPAHWAVERLKLSTESCQNGIWGNDAQGDEHDVICIRVADFDRNRMRASLDNPTYRNVTAAEFKSRMVSQGDLLLEKSGGGEKQPVGFVVLYEDEVPAICANFIARIKLAAGMNPSFWRYVHAAGYSIGLNVPSIKQTSGIQNLDQHSYLNERAAFPPAVEQARIAAFLDHETVRIDALVEEQQRLIELLKEKRQAVISHAVTKGLDPDVPMKDSGVEWLERLPENWEIAPFRRGIDFLTDYEANGSFASTKEMVSLDAGEPYAWFVRATDLENDRVGLVEGNRFCDKASYDFLEKTRVFGRELLVSKRGEIGKVYVLPELNCRATIAPNLYLIRLNDNLSPRFAYYWLSSSIGNPHLRLADKSTTIGALYKDDVKAIPFIFPPRGEQERVVAFLDSELQFFNKMIHEATAALRLLQERRSALISAAVTGKIDVRGWQPPAGSTAFTEATRTEAI